MPLDIVVVVAVAALVGLLAGAGSAALAIRLHIANSFATEREEVRSILGRARIDLENAGEELEKWSQRGARERARVEQAAKRSAKPNGELTPVPLRFADLRSYSRHLQKGGARDSDYERSLGWQNSPM